MDEFFASFEGNEFFRYLNQGVVFYAKNDEDKFRNLHRVVDEFYTRKQYGTMTKIMPAFEQLLNMELNLEILRMQNSVDNIIQKMLSDGALAARI
jgi:hypothetical protein